MNLVCLFPSLSLCLPILLLSSLLVFPSIHFSYNKWSVIPLVPLSMLSTHFTPPPPCFSVRSVLLLFIPFSISSLWHPSLSFAPLFSLKLVCYSLSCLSSIHLLSSKEECSSFPMYKRRRHFVSPLNLHSLHFFNYFLTFLIFFSSLFVPFPLSLSSFSCPY